jgi:hypothetical protein
MHHIFFTSLAEDLSSRDGWPGSSRDEILRSSYIKYESEEDRVYDVIDFYLKRCSKFYLSQVESPHSQGDTFEVYASYGNKYLPLIEQFDFPDYINLIYRGPGFSTTREQTPENPFQLRCDFLFDEKFKDTHTGKPISITRIDADDILSNRTFANISAETHRYRDFPYFYILYKRYRQFERATNKYTVPLFHHSPGFATVAFPCIDNDIYNHEDGSVSQLRMWPHDCLHARMHTEADFVGALQSIGNNVGNWLRDAGSGPGLYDDSNTRVYGGYEEGYNPKSEGFMDLSGWTPVKGKIVPEWVPS